MITELENKVKIEGILEEIDLTETTFNKDGRSTEAIRGSFTVRVETEINKEPKTLSVPVSVFVPKYKKDQPTVVRADYAKYHDMMTSWVSIAAGGLENADCVRVNNGKIQSNEFWGRNGQLVSTCRISQGFIDKIPRDKMHPEASFSVIFAVGDEPKYEVDKDGVETKRFKLRGLVPTYSGGLNVVDFYAYNPGVISAISSYWQKGDTVKAKGVLNFSYKTETYVPEVDFGEATPETRTVSVNELVLTGGNSNPIDGEMAMTTDEITNALAARQAHLEELKNKKPVTPAPKASNSTPSFKDFDLGF